VDRVAATGFGAGAEAYHRGRPSWPLAAVDAAFEHWSLPPDAGLVVDLAAGTGLLTERLARRCPRLLAVEPVDEMRGHITFAEAVAGTAEHLPLSDGAASAIFVSEAFHWFDQPAALAEIARVLRPGGGLAILWNHPLSRQPWSAELTALLAEHHYHPKGLGLGTGDAREKRDWQHGPDWASFEPLTYREFEHRQTVTRADAVARVASFSYIASLDAARRDEVLARVDALLAEHGVTEYEQRWRCDLYLTRRC
jgi:SAM-dependent methyltransferase